MNSNIFNDLFGLDLSVFNKLNELSAYEIVNYIYMVADNPKLNVVAPCCIINETTDLVKLKQIFSLIDCTKINSSVAVGLLRSVYVLKHIVNHDFNRILTYFLEPTEESKNLFIGLDLDYNDF